MFFYFDFLFLCRNGAIRDCLLGGWLGGRNKTWQLLPAHLNVRERNRAVGEVRAPADGQAQGSFLWKPWQFLCISPDTVTASTQGGGERWEEDLLHPAKRFPSQIFFLQCEKCLLSQWFHWVGSVTSEPLPPFHAINNKWWHRKSDGWLHGFCGRCYLGSWEAHFKNGSTVAWVGRPLHICCPLHNSQGWTAPASLSTVL